MRDRTAPGAGSVEPHDHPPQAFPEADWAWFTERCATLGIPGPDQHRAKLEAIFGHLVGVNAWLNLTRLTAAKDYLKNHVLDSLVVVGDARLRHASEGSWCADLGSGGGYPGLPLAVWFPRLRWALIDARKRKADFLSAAGTLTGASVRGFHLRGADAANLPSGAELRQQCQLVTSRAMAQAEEVLAEAAPLLHHHGHCLMWKGQTYLGAERAAALKAAPHLGYRFVSERKIVLEGDDPERYIVAYEKL